MFKAVEFVKLLETSRIEKASREAYIETMINPCTTRWFCTVEVTVTTMVGDMITKTIRTCAASKADARMSQEYIVASQYALVNGATSRIIPDSIVPMDIWYDGEMPEGTYHAMTF